MANCGDPSQSAETCSLPWYQAFSALCAGVGTLAGAIAGAVLGGPSAGGAFAVIGALVGYCACRLSPQRLPAIQPAGDPSTGQTSVAGIVMDLGRSFALFPFGDGDYLFNIRCAPRNLLDTQFDGTAACVRTKDVINGPEYMHCEITSNVTLYGCAGAIIGAGIAAPMGMAAGLAAGAAVAAACVVTGIFAPLCILAAIVIAALVSAGVTTAGAAAGAAVGSGLGLAPDEFENQAGEAGADTITCGDAVIFTGDWVTDRDHGWNELHDLKAIMVIDREKVTCENVAKLASAVTTGLMAAPRRPR